MVIVDTTVWVDFLNGVSNPETEWLDREAGRKQIALLDLILCEVLQGVRHDRDFDAFRRQLLEFDVFSIGGVDTAARAARHFRGLRKRGFTVRKTADCLIAAFCIREGFRLLHRERDFDVFETNLGLQVIHP